MSTPFLGQISMMTFNFPPKGWAFCNGQLLPISQNQALFALLGTFYGGDGRSNFGLPNLQGQVPIHMGQGSGLSSYALGQTGGQAAVTIGATTMPEHSHTFNATTTSATAPAIADDLLPATPTIANGSLYAVSQPSPNPALVAQQLAAASCGPTGGSQPHSNLMPSLTISFVIALQGVFPSQN